jgi:hypothetical protein
MLVVCYRNSVSRFTTIQLRLINKFNTDFESILKYLNIKDNVLFKYLISINVFFFRFEIYHFKKIGREELIKRLFKLI